MVHMDEEQAVFEQLTLSDFKNSTFTTLKSYSQVWKLFWKLKALYKNAEKRFSP